MATRSKSQANDNLRKQLMLTRKGNKDIRKNNMANKTTTDALATALEAVTNQMTNQTTKHNGDVKLEACPIKRKNCSLQAWLTEVELWDNANDAGEPEKLNMKKYLAFMDSIRNAEDKELERMAEIEFG